MIINEDDKGIIHFGVRGMRWGVRKSREQINADRQKIKNILEKNKSDINRYEKSSLKYAAKSPLQKAISTVAFSTVGPVLAYVMSKAANKGTVFNDPKLLKSTLADIAFRSSVSAAQREFTASQTLKRYNNDGTRKADKKQYRKNQIPVDQLASSAVQVGLFFAPLAVNHIKNLKPVSNDKKKMIDTIIDRIDPNILEKGKMF